MRKFTKVAASFSSIYIFLIVRCICLGCLVHAIKISPTEENNKLRRVIVEEDNTTSTSNTTHGAFSKTNFCALSNDVDSGDIVRRHALRGLDITVGGHYIFDRNSGKIDEGYIGVLVLDEVAKRAGFKWRGTAEAVDTPSKNQTWTDVLDYTASHYDLAVATWTRVPDRLAIGIIFPESWYDTGLIMVQVQDGSQQTSFGWKLFAPFAWSVWALICFTLIISGLIYYLIDNIYYRGDKEKIDKGINDSLFYSFQVLTGTSNFNPTYFSNRVLLISLRIFCIVVLAAYRANLTAILVNKDYVLRINVIEDVIRQNQRMCVLRGSPDIVRIQSHYPNGKYVEKDSPLEMYQGINNGECGILLDESDKFKSYKNKVEYNPKCNLDRVGRHVTTTKGSFGLKGSKQLCSALLHDVLDIYLLEMLLDKTLTRLMKATQQTKTNKCKFESHSGAQRLTVRDVGGAFAFHAILLAFAIVLSLILRVKHPNDVKTVKRGSDIMEQRIQVAFAERGSNNPQSLPPSQDQCADDIGLSYQETKIQKMMLDLHEDLKDELRSIFHNSAEKAKKCN